MFTFGPIGAAQLIPVIGTALLILAWVAAAIVVLVVRRRRSAGVRVVGGPAVSALRLTKRYGDRVVLDDLSFELPPGRVLALLGPNGAGKTTLLRILAGLADADAGQASIFGVPVTPGAPVLARAGITIDEPGVVPHLTGRQNLVSLWRISGRDPADAHVETVIELTGLGAVADHRAGTYSMGLRQRLALAQAMLGLPELLILDEPTNGLDPDQIADLTAALGRYSATGRTIVVSTHQLPELAVLCTDALVIREGRVAWSGPLDAVPAPAGGDSGSPDRLTTVYRASGRAPSTPAPGRPALDASATSLPVIDHAVAPGGACSSRPALSTRTEIARQLQRRGTWVLLAAACLIPLILAVVLRMGTTDFLIEGDVLGRLATAGAANFTVVTLFLGSQLFLVVAVAYLFGDSIARESAWRYLRVLATVPVPRSRLVLVKAAALAALVAVGVLVYAAVSYLVGWAFFGSGTLLPVAGPGVTGAQIYVRLAMMVGYILVYLSWVAALALLLSVLAGDNASVAATATIALTIGSHLLGAFSSFGTSRGWLPTRNYDAWVAASRLVFDPTSVLWGIFLSLLYTSVFLVAALAVMNIREIRR
ncbi:ATP-binding cassette domain-containing protein [Gordonia sp. (in: high G+C Gram-positive bacteria)]|uniref:ATP-binding cassette domain-containing protein n=1 Tax=Gordonia sp. (in: high G+C Gram-positive bacteria) TaxID=84139 RepID=UPI00262DC12D|nr:ATP-binding cassette domain-containing protein [Gordonia sp. (in: high G+C Gram-positive bacteria)]